MRRCVGTFSSLTPVTVLSLDDMLSRLDVEHGALPYFLIDTTPGPDERLESAQDQNAVQEFLKTLPPRERAIVHRFFWAEETQTTIADDMGVSKMAISKLLAKVAAKGQAALSAKHT